MLQITIVVMMVSMMLWAGLDCRFADIRAALADFGFTARALVFSVILVPLLALLFSRVLGLAPDFETGILLMAVSGGVPFLPLTIASAGGDLRAAVGLVFLLSIVSIVTAPLTVNLVSASIDIHGLPVGQFIGKLVVFQLVPLAIASLAASYLKPEVTRVLRPTFRAVASLAAVTVLVMLGGKVWTAFATVFATRTILAIALVLATSMLIAWAFGGRDHGKRVVLTDATGSRNPAIALLLATASFASPATESAVIAYLVLQAVADMVGGVLMKRASPRAASAPPA
jgi:bile acid:Na+ symporter, BASS family